MVCPEQPVAVSPAPPRAPYTFTYCNHRGEVSTRRVIPMEVYFGATEFYPEDQWLMVAFDLDRDLPRTFAMNLINKA